MSRARDISGSRLLSAFFVESRAALIVASTSVPDFNSSRLSSSSRSDLGKDLLGQPVLLQQVRKRRIVDSSLFVHRDQICPLHAVSVIRGCLCRGSLVQLHSYFVQCARKLERRRKRRTHRCINLTNSECPPEWRNGRHLHSGLSNHLPVDI
jgi:hypothetical protein